MWACPWCWGDPPPLRRFSKFPHILPFHVKRIRTTMRTPKGLGMRTTLELPDPLFARLKARAASERVTLKQLLRTYVEQRLSAAPSRNDLTRSSATLARLGRIAGYQEPPAQQRRHIHHQQAVHYWEQQAAEKARMPIWRL
jgi:predicted DNA-binding ribbon-helix-helix protein